MANSPNSSLGIRCPNCNSYVPGPEFGTNCPVCCALKVSHTYMGEKEERARERKERRVHESFWVRTGVGRPPKWLGPVAFVFLIVVLLLAVSAYYSPSRTTEPEEETPPPSSSTADHSIVWLVNLMPETIDVVRVSFDDKPAYLAGPISPYDDRHKVYWHDYWSLPATVRTDYTMLGEVDPSPTYEIPDLFYFGYNLYLYYDYTGVTYSITPLA